MHWFVGDLQGCYEAFAELLDAIDFDPGRDELWCVGDLVNRGPQTLETLRLWREVGGKAVLGNHEVYLLQAWAGRWPRKPDTLDALFAAPDAEELIAALDELPVLAPVRVPGAEIPEVWVVHGGLHPHWRDLDAVHARLEAQRDAEDRLESPELRFATRVRCCDASGTLCKHAGLPRDCPAPCAPWDEHYRGDAWVVHGHWAMRGHYRNDARKVIGLDSGAVYGGPLTAWCMEEDRVVQV